MVVATDVLHPVAIAATTSILFRLRFGLGSLGPFGEGRNHFRQFLSIKLVRTTPIEVRESKFRRSFEVQRSLEEVKGQLQVLKPALRKRFKVETIDIFGSYARSE